MIRTHLIRPSEYHDSVTLMEIARELTGLAGVVDAAVLMGTAANKGLLREANLLSPALEAAGANDLLIAVLAEHTDAADQALVRAEEILARRPAATTSNGDCQPRTLSAARRAQPAANLALISVPGEYAADLAWEALHEGLHVWLFSDRVSLADEVALKRYAAEHDLLVMGPDCGTALLNGVALGFANRVPLGPVGIVAASGTGLQEVSCQLANLGVGVSQGIGTGGRDLSAKVGGITMLQGIEALQNDPQTEVLLLISKPPAVAVAERMLARATAGVKPVVVCFLGGDPGPISAAGAIPAATLQEAAFLAAAEVEGTAGPAVDELLDRQEADLAARAAELKTRLVPAQRFGRGLYSGGTLAYEALLIWRETLSGLSSNLHLPGIHDLSRVCEHQVLDLGADEFTSGRPHPMIDNGLRLKVLYEQAADPAVALILLDLVLGYGAHPDPAAELAPAIRQVCERAAVKGRDLLVVASITGTPDDLQDMARQAALLQEVGVELVSCNAAAARLAALIVAGR